MPKDPMIWVVLIVAIGIVVALALWKGSGVKFIAKGIGVDIKERQSPTEASTTVFKDGQVGKVGSVGNITGVKGQTGDSALHQGKVDVAGGAIVRGSAGDITGVEIAARPKEKQ